MSGNIWSRRQFDHFIELIDVSLLLLNEHNFITDVRKGGDFLKSYWAKWSRKQEKVVSVKFFHARAVKMAKSNIFTCKLHVW